MANLLQLTLFGSPEIRLHGQAVIGFRSSKAQALLYYLAVTGRPHTRPTLAGLFWGDQPEVSARASLSKCLSNLRDLIGDALLIERHTVAFNRDYPYDLDIERFAAAVEQPLTVATSQALQAALALYRGGLLEGFYVREAPDFEQWLLIQRAHYREAVINGLRTLAGFYEQGGDLPSAIAYTRRLLTLEPWREEAHRQLMTLLAHNGQRAAALAQFETCRRVLEEELAVEPDAETVALVEAIRAGDFDKVNGGNPLGEEHLLTLSPPDSVMPNLPIPPTPLIGRERELAELGALISDPQCRLITITGPGGMGKTRLALAAAANQSGNFQHGAVFVPLAGISSAQFLPQAILTALNVPLQGTLSPQQQVRATLYSQERLLVLDNYEQLLPDVELLLDMLHYAPKLSLLITSRERLALQAEYLFEMTGLAYPVQPPTPQRSESTADLTKYAAIQLFLQRVRQTQPRFTPSDTNIAAMVHICGKLDGIPLAIELAAARARILPIEHIAARLNDRLNLLTSGSRTAPPRHQTLRAAIDWSYDLLADTERVLLCRLSVFAGSFSLEAIEQVCGPFPSPVIDLMLHLVDKSLVTVTRAGDEMLYRLLDTISEYAHEKLVAAGEETQLRLNHLNFFTQLAETADAQLLGGQQQHWLIQLERAHDNLRVALNWTVKQAMHTEALRLGSALGEFWDVHGYWREGQQWLEQALALHKANFNLNGTLTERSWRAKALWLAGNFRWRYRDFVGAHACLQECLALYRQLNDLAGQSNALGHLGHVAFDQGHDEDARSLFEGCLALRIKVGNKSPIGYALFSLGMLAVNRSDYATAQTVLVESLNLFREAENKLGVSLSLFVLGDVSYLQTNYEGAQAFYEESLALRRELGDKRGIASALASVANVRLKLGDNETAQTFYRQSLAIYRELDNQRGVGRVITGLARIRQMQGHFQLATSLLSAVETLLMVLNTRLSPPEHSDLKQAITFLRTQLDEVSFNSAWEKGCSLTLEEAITLAR